LICSSSSIVLPWNFVSHKGALKSTGVPAWSFSTQFWAVLAASASRKGTSATLKNMFNFAACGYIRAIMVCRKASRSCSQEGPQSIVQTYETKKN